MLIPTLFVPQIIVIAMQNSVGYYFSAKAKNVSQSFFFSPLIGNDLRILITRIIYIQAEKKLICAGVNLHCASELCIQR